MAITDRFKLEKLTVNVYGNRLRVGLPEKKFRVMYNPESFSMQHKNVYQGLQGINTSGRRVVGVTGDTTSDTQTREAIAEATRQLGGTIDILVNAAAEPAGFAGPPKLQQISGEYFHAEMDTKVMGYIRCAREVVDGMRAQGWGRIVNISGLAARQSGSAVGSMRNIAVAALTKNMADELGPAGIQVTVVHPGLTRTERTAPLVAARAREQGVAESAIEAQMAAGNSIQHLVTADEVAWVVAFLCSPKSRAINGDAIAAGGGAPRSIHY